MKADVNICLHFYQIHILPSRQKSYFIGVFSNVVIKNS